MVDAVLLESPPAPGCRPRDRVSRRRASAHGASRCQTAPKPKKAGTTARRSPSCCVDEVLDRGEHAVLGPALARCRVGIGQAARRADPGSPGTSPLPSPAVGWRSPVGNQLGREVVVAAGVRPGHVVEEQQRQLRAAGPLADQPQLLANHVVVVVAVDHHDLGQGDPRQRVEAGARGSARPARARARAPRAGPVATGRSPARALRSPAAQSASSRVRSPGEGAHLDHQLGAGGIEAREHQLRMVRHRGGPARGIVDVGIDLRLGLLHRWGQSIACDFRQTATRSRAASRPSLASVKSSVVIAAASGAAPERSRLSRRS